MSSGRPDTSNDPVQAFVSSLQDGRPPGPTTALLRAVWHGLKGEWETAHELAQAEAGEDGAWVHAWLHRIEGDLGNAAYWYRRAGHPTQRGDTREEGLKIARSLIERSGA